MRFILLLLLDCFQLRHDRIVTECEHIYLFIHHCHAFCIILMLLDFLSFWVFPNRFLLEIFIQVLPSILSFCVWDIFLSAHRWRRTFERSYPTYFIQYVFWCNAFFLGYLTLLAFWISFVAWDYFKYHTIVHLLPFHGSLVVSFLGQTLVWNECILKIVFETFLTLVIL